MTNAAPRVHHRGERRAGDAHARRAEQAQDQHGVEHQSERHGAREKQERRARVARRPERRVDGEEAEDERRAEEVGVQVAAAERRDALGRVHDREQRVEQRRSERRDHDAKR
jgi:hypothetical protein